MFVRAASCALLFGSVSVDTTMNEAQASPRIARTHESAVTASSESPPRSYDKPVGNLEHPSRLSGLFTRLSALEAGRAQADVRIVQYGDSHTASDYGTSVARTRLTARFGDGGRGFIPLGDPYKRLFQAGEAVTRASGFTADEASASKHGDSDNLCGPTGIAMVTRTGGASMTSELSASADSYEVAYLAQPRGGSFDVYVDGKKLGRVATDQSSRAAAFRTFDVARGSHSLEVRAAGDGELRIFGVRLDDKAFGMTFDSFGINGAKSMTPLASNEAHQIEELAHIAPSLVITAYGTNETGDSTTSPDEHGAAIRTFVARVQKASPGASCLVLGPPDRGVRNGQGIGTMSKLADIIAAQRKAADEAGCAFFDQFSAMGGAGSIGKWSSESPPRARRDLVHLTRAGYANLADALSRDVITAYDDWKTRSASLVSSAGTH